MKEGQVAEEDDRSGATLAPINNTTAEFAARQTVEKRDRGGGCSALKFRGARAHETMFLLTPELNTQRRRRGGHFWIPGGSGK